ncbi:pilus assembly protein [Erwinia sp. 198]|nr:pilus assembly protein [Erwinia sp. 198]
MKKKLVAALLPLSLLTAHNAFANDEDVPSAPTPITVSGGTIQFNGTIVNTPCAIDIGADGHVVELGQYRADDFNSTGDVTPTRTFNIGLNSCAVDTYSKAAITFSGNTAAGNNKALSVDGGAGGVGIQIMQNSTALAVDGSEASAAASLMQGNNNLIFQAQYIALADTVTPGAANATANFMITYQ